MSWMRAAVVTIVTEVFEVSTTERLLPVALTVIEVASIEVTLPEILSSTLLWE
jgi:hypothetical protein